MMEASHHEHPDDMIQETEKTWASMEQIYWLPKCVFFLFLMMFLGCRTDHVIQSVEIIPEPVHLDTLSGYPFVVDDHSIIYISDSSMIPPAEVLLASLNDDYDIEMVDSSLLNLSGISLIYSSDTTMHEQGYLLEIQTQRIIITARKPIGLWNGVQTLRQILPSNPDEVDYSELPTLRIVDYPRFEWRGMHLDVARHFMPVDFVKKYIEMLSYHKINMFHWHLVDGVGWRIEIKSHPELTEKGAWRVVKPGRQPWEEFELWEEGDPRPKYGGYYTQDEIREVVKFARERGITIVPEIEMPSHSEAVLECYPQLRCIDEEGLLLPNIGVFCPGQPATYGFLEDVLTEVLELFPSPYIHIGGDEVDHSIWEKCVRDKAFMEEHNLTAGGLQSHFINHFERFLRERGRILIGWHDMLTGRINPSASVMYWGHPEELETTLRKGHQTILSTGNIYYFDHYQSTSIHEPQAFGGLSTLTQVYQYEPLPPDLESKYGTQVLGIQANVWTEYIPDPDHVEYMAFPRMAALAESAWSPRESKDFERFKMKLPRLLESYQHQDIHYSMSAYRPIIQTEIVTDTPGLAVILQPELESELYYTTNGEVPSPSDGIPYKEPFVLTESTTVRAGAFYNENPLVEPESRRIIVHSALGKEVELLSKPYPRYSADGPVTLTDGKFGGNNWGNGYWLGVLNNPFEAILHLSEEEVEVERVGISAIEDKGSGIHFPDKIRVSLSKDGRTYEEIGFEDIYNDEIQYDSKTRDSIFYLTFPPNGASFLKIEALPVVVPNQGVFIFLDEIIVQ